MSRKDKIPTPNFERGPNQNVFTFEEIEKKCFYRRDFAKEYIFNDTGKIIRRKNWPKPKLQEVKQMKYKCIDCGVEIDGDDETCDKCDFRRNYPDMDEAKVDKIFWKNYKRGGHNRCHKKK